MADDRYEPNRVLGVPISRGPHARQGEEPQRFMGFPADWVNDVNLDWLSSLAHPIRGYRRWARRRHPGAYLMDEDEPGREG